MVEFFGEEVAKAVSKILRYKEIDTNDLLERMNEKYFVVGLRGKARRGDVRSRPISRPSA